jgi:hypothetical protein
MFTKAALGLAVVLATLSGAAAMKPDSTSQSAYTNVYNPLGANVGSDPDLNIRFELNRDWGRGN